MSNPREATCFMLVPKFDLFSLVEHMYYYWNYWWVMIDETSYMKKIFLIKANESFLFHFLPPPCSVVDLIDFYLFALSSSLRYWFFGLIFTLGLPLVFFFSCHLLADSASNSTIAILHFAFSCWGMRSSLMRFSFDTRLIDVFSANFGWNLFRFENLVSFIRSNFFCAQLKEGLRIKRKGTGRNEMNVEKKPGIEETAKKVTSAEYCVTIFSIQLNVLFVDVCGVGFWGVQMVIYFYSLLGNVGSWFFLIFQILLNTFEGLI